MAQVSRRGVMSGLGAAAALGPRSAKAAGTIQVWWTQGFYEQEDKALKDLVATFEKESGIKVDLQIMNGPDLITKMIAALQVGDVPPGAINWGDVDNNNAFYAKQIVMTPNATISIAVAQMEKKDQYFRDIITRGIPAGNDGKPVPSILGVTSAFIPKAAKNIGGGKAFLKWFIQPANLNTYLKEARGRWLPVMPAALKDDPYWLDPSDPHRPVAAKYGLILPVIAPWQTYTPAYAQVASEQIWAGAEANITQKNMTPEQAAEAAIKRIKEVFAQFPME